LLNNSVVLLTKNNYFVSNTTLLLSNWEAFFHRHRLIALCVLTGLP